MSSSRSSRRERLPRQTWQAYQSYSSCRRSSSKEPMKPQAASYRLDASCESRDHGILSDTCRDLNGHEGAGTPQDFEAHTVRHHNSDDISQYARLSSFVSLYAK